MPRVAVAMSGGVDSSVAAALAVEAGHEAFGVTLKLLAGEPTGFGCCGAPRDIEDARRVCERLGIPHYVFDFDRVFERDVIVPFVEAYRRQRTPNPCVECNRSVKFGALLRLAAALEADLVATGHYARVETGADGVHRLLAADDEGKDQSYFLYTLAQRELGRALFPVGGLSKPEVRAVARRLGLPTAEKPESQEICFAGRDYRAFLERRGARDSGPGEIRDAAGRTLGRHGGLAGYTVGQRKGLGVAAGTPLYVNRIDGGANVLVVGPDRETFCAGLRAGRVSWTRGPAFGEASVRIRHRAPPAPARLSAGAEGAVLVEFLGPQRAVAPGQAAVFYRGREVLGGGEIEEALA